MLLCLRTVARNISTRRRNASFSARASAALGTYSLTGTCKGKVLRWLSGSGSTLIQRKLSKR